MQIHHSSTGNVPFSVLAVISSLPLVLMKMKRELCSCSNYGLDMMEKAIVPLFTSCWGSSLYHWECPCILPVNRLKICNCFYCQMELLAYFIVVILKKFDLNNMIKS